MIVTYDPATEQVVVSLMPGLEPTRIPREVLDRALPQICRLMGVELADDRRLRADLDHERERRDELEDALIRALDRWEP